MSLLDTITAISHNNSDISATNETIAENMNQVYYSGYGNGYGNGERYGYEKGYAEGYPNGEKDGYSRGYTDGTASVDTTEVYNEGFEAGKEAEYTSFWNEVHNNIANGANAFSGYIWTDNNFRPTRDIVIKYGERIFSACSIKDLDGCLKRQGVSLDTSQATTMAYAFSSSARIQHLDVIDCSGVNRLGGMYYIAYACSSLKSIDRFILPPDPSKAGNYSGMLNYCGALERVMFEGVIGANGLDLSGSPNLDHDSLMSVINCLAQTSTTLTVTLGATNLAKLTNEEKAIATEKGWTLA